MSTFIRSFRRLSLLSKYLHWEEGVMYRLNHVNAIRGLRRIFAVSSRLGNGVAWYTLAILLAVFGGSSAWLPMSVMMMSAGLGLAIYATIKHFTARPRPQVVHDGLVLSVTPLDKYSFPSGHTLHAVNFAIQITAFAPALAWLVIPFALMVALSRMVLGLHYLSDVLVGAAIGALLAVSSLWLVSALV
ncbi:MAG TPA: phosphatase PAP2 family protein [Halothiobacillus sp.]|nr:phosphatase PAP2 family protein [Halothiobacillus sp.]